MNLYFLSAVFGALSLACFWFAHTRPGVPTTVTEARQSEWPEIAPDGITAVPSMNTWAKIAGEENKWVMWTRAQDGGVTWLYARRTEWEVPASTQTIFSEIEGLPWPKPR